MESKNYYFDFPSKRSVFPNHHIRPDMKSAPMLYTPDMVAKYISTKIQLLRHSLSVIERYDNVYRLTDLFNYAYFITDENGVVLHVCGQEDIVECARRLGIVPGGSLSYNHVGENGVGTALAVRKPTSIFGEEHYLDCFKDYACASTLIRNSDDRTCRGVLNIACRAKDYRDYLLGLAIIIGTIIEDAMKMQIDPMHSKIDNLVNDQIDVLIKLKKSENLQHIHKSITAEIIKSNSAGESFIFKSPVMVKCVEKARRVATFDTMKLITGCTGVGKEVLAKFIHDESTRAGRPFIVVNCGAIPHNLLGSELFGYERGAFTGAVRCKKGKFELANTGSILLDEIGEMPFDLQSYLLRIIEEKEIVRLGGTKVIPLDVQIIASTNRDLVRMVEKGVFRLDLYHRLKVAQFNIPPLKERKEEIPILVAHYLQKLSRKYGIQKMFTERALEALIEYDWPGNIRELRNSVESAYIMSISAVIDINELSAEICSRKNDKSFRINDTSTSINTEGNEIQNINAVLKKCRGKITKAASMLNVSRPTLYKIMQKNKIPLSKYRT